MAEAVKYCHVINMSLVAIGSLQELNSYLPMLKSIRLEILPTHSQSACILKFKISGGVSVWTSGSSEGDHCADERTFSWCSTGGVFRGSDDGNNSESWWNVIGGKSPTSENCLMLKNEASAAKLQPAACNATVPFICEV